MNVITKYLIPHPHNDHRPHLLRLPAMMLVLEFMLVAQIVVLITGIGVLPRSSFLGEIIVSVLVL